MHEGPAAVWPQEGGELIRSLRELNPSERLLRPKSLCDFVEQASHPKPYTGNQKWGHKDPIFNFWRRGGLPY